VNQTPIGLKSKHRHWSTYNRLQLSLGMLFSIALPVLLSWHLYDASDRGVLLNTATAGFVAVLGGLAGYSQFKRYPSLHVGEFVTTSFGLSFLGTIAALFYFRIDYSRFLFSAIFVAATLWFLLIYTIARRNSQLLFAVVPSGDVHPVLALNHSQFDVHLIQNVVELDSRWDGIVADFRSGLGQNWERLLAAAVLRGVPVFHVKNFVEQISGRVDIEHLSENTLGSFSHQGYLQVRQAAERVLAAIALLALAPLFALVALAIRLESDGPVLFRQKRVGFRAKPFEVLKFRTMRHRTDTGDNCPRHDAMTQPNDDRVTRLGRLLRRSRIDELPQLINIVRGEMSWIGPRPEAVPLAQWYEAELPFYHYRHMVRPGITGWAQVSQGHVTTVDEVRGKLQYDFYYIKHLSFWLDLLIVFRTVRIVCTGFGAR
jgi:lipopolysaccharide/colanic/teichoic acid biosynthesis glycosyltransferase